MRASVAHPEPKDAIKNGEHMTDFAAARLAMVDCQVRPSDVTAYPIIDAMLSVKKEEFVPPEKRGIAYAGDHIELISGWVVLDGRTLGKLLDAVMVTPDDLVLDLGCGLGYVAAILGRLAATVVAVESEDELASSAAAILAQQDALNVIVELGALAEGAPEHGPYDIVFFEGAVERVPESIIAQIKIGGKIAAIFMDGPTGQARIGVKTANGVTWRRAFDATAPVLDGFSIEKAFEF